MKTTMMICALMLGSSGMMFAHNHHRAKLSGDDVVALETSSPRVHVARKHHVTQKDRQYHVVTTKKTINAYVPYGK